MPASLCILSLCHGFAGRNIFRDKLALCNCLLCCFHIYFRVYNKEIKKNYILSLHGLLIPYNGEVSLSCLISLLCPIPDCGDCTQSYHCELCPSIHSPYVLLVSFLESTVAVQYFLQSRVAFHFTGSNHLSLCSWSLSAMSRTLRPPRTYSLRILSRLFFLAVCTVWA